MIADLVKFLVEHADWIELAYDAITNKGVTKEQLTAAIQRAAVEASDAAMKAELGDT